MRIAISGHSGCGNTTATTNVAKALNLKVMNFTFRDLAKELKMGFDELHAESSTNPSFDYLTDLTCIRAAHNDGIVVGSRLAAWLVNADLRIWLYASLEARAGRICKRETEKNSTYEAVLYKTLKRDESNRKRYLQLYGVDINDHSDFDITINTERLTAEQVSGLIVSAAQWASANQLKRTNFHLNRIREILAENLQLPEDVLFGTNPVDTVSIHKNFKQKNISIVV